MTKLRIWVVDDVDTQREMVISALVPSSVQLTNGFRAKYAKAIFDIQEFSSAREAEVELSTCTKENAPDLILSDNDFSASIEMDKEDNRADRGLFFLEKAQEMFPKIHKILVTSFMINPYIERFLELQGKSFLTLFAIDRDKISSEGRLNQHIRDLATQKLYLLDEQGKELLSGLYPNKSSLFEPILGQAPDVDLKNKTYNLGSLLAPWAKLNLNANNDGIELVLQQEEFSKIADTILTKSQKQDFNGQLDFSPSYKDNEDKTAFRKQVQRIITADQSERIEQLIPEISNALSVFFLSHPSWLNIHEEEHLDAVTQSAIIKQSEPIQDLALLRNQCSSSNLKLPNNSDEAQWEQSWQNILRCRLTILGVFALQQRGTLFKQLPFAIDFAIQVVIRNNPKYFLRRLYEEYPGIAKAHEVANDARLRGNGVATTNQFFHTFCGLAGWKTNRVVDAGKSLFKIESIQPNCLYPSEQRWLQEIKKSYILRDAMLTQ